jgi:hypothetical protein
MPLLWPRDVKWAREFLKQERTMQGKMFPSERQTSPLATERPLQPSTSLPSPSRNPL